MNNRITLWRNDRIPYGTYYAYKNLGHIFPNSTVMTSDESPETFGGSNYSSAYIIIGPTLRPSEDELKAILQHAISGNHVFISAMSIGDNLLDTFRLKQQYNDMFEDSLTVNIYDPGSGDTARFQYPGMKLDGYFSGMDSAVTNILGRNEHGQPNFVKFSYQGGGSVFIHYAPLA
ncbi:MAG: hypothetical protein JNK79_10835, partial [Chitinophagaceae bacterium]|nr:hypothetical protein [Chitinophagaceae bacterium]